ncbi:hypothetical protein HZB05_02390 [Candidatus Wolfebacteria bacterium]|nr:hypothetical protein [Candidatus Wolfebacteria bacterium]
MNLRKAAVGVIGLGFVGNIIFNYLKNKKFSVLGYDKFKKIGNLADLEKADLIFICLPTPYKEKIGSDISAIKENITFFKKPHYFVIRSTVLPGTTDDFQKKYPKHKFLFHPEFLREKTAKKDFLNPNLQLVGYTSKTKDIAPEILKIFPKAKYNKVLSAKAAELTKFSINAFLASKVIFANQIYDLCQVLGINYEEVKNCLGNESRIGHSHLDIFHNNFRGFGGKCLPKDLKSLIYFYEKNQVSPFFFKTIDELNHKLLSDQNMTDIMEKYWFNNFNHTEEI